MNTRKYIREYYDLLRKEFFKEHNEEDFISYTDLVLNNGTEEWIEGTITPSQLKKICGPHNLLGKLASSKIRFTKNDYKDYIEISFITPQLVVALEGSKKLNNDPEKTYFTTHKVETGLDGLEYDAYYPESTPCRYTLFTNGYVNNSKGKWCSKNNFWNPLIKKQDCGNRILYEYYNGKVFIVEK